MSKSSDFIGLGYTYYSDKIADTSRASTSRVGCFVFIAADADLFGLLKRARREDGVVVRKL